MRCNPSANRVDLDGATARQKVVLRTHQASFAASLPQGPYAPVTPVQLRPKGAIGQEGTWNEGAAMRRRPLD